MVMIEFITDLPPFTDRWGRTFDALMVMADQDAMKGVILSPCTKTIDAMEMATLYYEGIFRRFGALSCIISDHSPQFFSKVFQELAKLCNSKSSISTAYHPQTDGGTKRMNQVIKAYLWIYCGNTPNEWINYATDMEFTHNQHVAQECNAYPFFLIMGYNP